MIVFLAPVLGRGVSMHARRACSSFWQPSALYPEEAQQPVTARVSLSVVDAAYNADMGVLGKNTVGNGRKG